MIKINLLPSKKKPPKKVSELQRQLLIAALILVLLGTGMGYYWMRQQALIESLEGQKAAAEARIREQDNLLKEVRNVEEDRKKIAEKIDIIEQLKKNQTGPVRILDELSAALPRGVNVTSLAETSGAITLEGEAFTNEDVVRFVEHLKASRYLAQVALLETSRTKLEGLDIYKYKLQFVYKGL